MRAELAPGAPRPKGLAKRIKERVGGDGAALVDAVVEVLEDPEASRRDKLEAASWLSDRAFGRPTTVIASDGDQPLQILVTSMLATAREQASQPAELEEGDGDSRD